MKASKPEKVPTNVDSPKRLDNHFKIEYRLFPVDQVRCPQLSVPRSAEPALLCREEAPRAIP